MSSERSPVTPVCKLNPLLAGNENLPLSLSSLENVLAMFYT